MDAIPESPRRKPKGVGKGLLTARQGHGAPNPKQIKAASEAATAIAAEINGFAGSNVGELMGTPLTAHFLGGCPIGSSRETGVIDPYHRLYGHPGISVVDGAAVSANLGVNPSLTITAQAERAMSYWPNARTSGRRRFRWSRRFNCWTLRSWRARRSSGRLAMATLAAS